MNKTTLTAALLLALGCGSLFAQDTLLGKLHPGKKEADIAKDWFEKKLPSYIKGLVETNNFVKTYLVFPGKDRNVKPCEIRDITKNGFRAYERIADNQDGAGNIVYRVARDGVEFTFKHWQPQHMINVYPVANNNDEADVSAFAAWLYSVNQPRLANRVLTVMHGRSAPDKPLIEAYIIEKEKLKAKPGQLELFNDWDSEYQVERNVLVTPDDKLKLISERETAAKKALEELRMNRGDYKQDPSRRSRQPRKLLVLIAWDIKEFKRIYAATELVKDKKTLDLLEEINKSIDSDKQIIRNNRDKAQALASSTDAEDLKKRAQILELILKLDPEDISLLYEVAAAWFDYARPEAHSNTCMNEEGAKRAIKYYEMILERFPTNTAFMINIGKCYQVQGDGKARDWYRKVISIDGEGAGNGSIAAQLIKNMDERDRNRHPDRERGPKK